MRQADGGGSDHYVTKCQRAVDACAIVLSIAQLITNYGNSAMNRKWRVNFDRENFIFCQHIHKIRNCI